MDSALYDKFLSNQSKLYRFAYSLTKNVSDAEDIHQETLIKIWEMREHWDEWRNFEAYSMRMTRTVYLNFYKAKNRHPYLDLSEVIENPVQNDIEKNITINDLKYTFNTMIMNLPKLQQNILYLREIEELEYKEIAHILDITESQVKVYLFRGRQYIKNNFRK